MSHSGYLDNPNERPRCWVCSQAQGKEVRVAEMFTAMCVSEDDSLHILVKCHGDRQEVVVKYSDFITTRNPSQDIRLDGWAFKNPAVESTEIPTKNLLIDI